MLLDLLLFLLTTVGCEAQQTRINLERNVYKRGINHSERAEFLYWHNFYRRQVDNPRPSDMIYLLYHKELETAALDWAVQCDFQHGNFNFTRHQLNPGVNIGQNIAVRIGGYSIQNAVFRWFDEHSDYSYKDKSCKPGAKCGHYEQVAGAVVTHIGCAVVYCPKYMNSKIVTEDAYNIVCDYYPSALRANWILKNNVRFREKLSIYEEGEPCTACPVGYEVCEDKLCRSSKACLTLDDQCPNPVDTTTCLCDDSVYPLRPDSGQTPSSPSSAQQSSPKQTIAVSVILSLITTAAAVSGRIAADLLTNKSTEPVDESATEISEVAEAVKQISSTRSMRTEIGTLETIYAEDRHHETNTSKTVLHEITTIAALPLITVVVTATSVGHFGSGDQSSSEEMQQQPLCFIKISTRFLTHDDVLPKDPGVIGELLFQKRWRELQRHPKLSLHVMEVVDSRAVPFGLQSVYEQHYNVMISAIACLIIRAYWFPTL